MLLKGTSTQPPVQFFPSVISTQPEDKYSNYVGHLTKQISKLIDQLGAQFFMQQSSDTLLAEHAVNIAVSIFTI